jgi:hypothetical protein
MIVSFSCRSANAFHKMLPILRTASEENPDLLPPQLLTDTDLHERDGVRLKRRLGYAVSPTHLSMTFFVKVVLRWAAFHAGLCRRYRHITPLRKCFPIPDHGKVPFLILAHGRNEVVEEPLLIQDLWTPDHLFEGETLSEEARKHLFDLRGLPVGIKQEGVFGQALVARAEACTQSLEDRFL